MTRGLRASLGLVRLLVAAAGVLAVAYLLSWRILWRGPVGSDTLYHLHLVSWVAGTFPGIDWWYRWDAAGIPYREAYPLASHWVTAALARATAVGLPQAVQLVQFAITPLCALGVYAFCAWRLRRPLVGLVAGILFLLSPMTWTFLVDWGFYANQAGTVFFMPVLMALDVFFHQWSAGARGWAFRLSALAAMGLSALMGLFAPSFAGVLTVMAAAYVLAIHRGGWLLRVRWFFVAVPLLGAGSVLLAAFWALPLQDYLALVASRQPARVYSPSLFPLVGLDQALGLHSIRPTEVRDRISLTPAVWLPGLVGAAWAFWDGRVRAFLALVGFGLISMTFYGFYALTYGLPLANYLLTFRSGMLFVQFLTPILAGLGLTAVPAALAALPLRRVSVPSPVRVTAAVLAAWAGLVAGAAGVAAFGERVEGYPHKLAYGAFSLDSRDLWSRHRDDVCVLADRKETALCRSPAVATAFSVAELVDACREAGRTPRAGVPICAALQDIDSPAWEAADDPLVAQTLAWCRNHDPVCQARYPSLAEQILDLGAWRPLRVGCFLPGCDQGAAESHRYRRLFATAPERAVVDAHAAALLMAFHDLVGGGQSYAYAFQLLPTPELDAWMLDSMLERPGTTAKGELARVSGADAVVLAGLQALQAADYERLEWRQVSQAPTVYGAPRPTGLAAQWPGGTTVLVVGASQNTPSHPYNEIFQRAAEGMIPFEDAWLVRGRSPYIDDYSDEELSKQSVVLLLGYRYHSSKSAWDRLDRYVRNGGRLYVETGWQYVDPDWNAGASPAALPVSELRWRALDPQAPVLAAGSVDTGWGAMVYGDGGWGASSSHSVRTGGDALVQVGDRVVVARWTRGKGRVLWSGMNLIAHAYASRSWDETQFLAKQWQWLLPAATEALAIEPRWSGGDTAGLKLHPSNGPVHVLFKESAAPGWSVELRWPSGRRRVRIEPAELDYMLVRLNAVPDGAELVFRYGSTLRTRAWGALSLVTLVLLLAWLVRPALYRRGRHAVVARLRAALQAVRTRAHWDDEEAA